MGQLMTLLSPQTNSPLIYSEAQPELVNDWGTYLGMDDTDHNLLEKEMLDAEEPLETGPVEVTPEDLFKAVEAELAQDDWDDDDTTDSDTTDQS